MSRFFPVLLACASIGLSACSLLFPPAAPVAPQSVPTGAKEVTSPTGLKYTITSPGKAGAQMAKTGDTVTVHYTGWLLDGTQFDSSRTKDTPFSFMLGAKKVIAGWDEGVAGMRVGEKRQLIIPGDLAYGQLGSPPTIGPNATLKFDVELLSIK